MNIAKTLLAGILLLAAPSAASATTIVAQTLQEMATTSDLIVLGVVTETHAELEDGNIVTLTEIEVEQQWGPAASGATTITVVTPGGRVGDLATRVAGTETFNPGERVVIYLRRNGDDRFSSSALAFSKFTVRAGDTEPIAFREADGTMMILGPDGLPVVGNSDEYPSFVPLDDLLDTIVIPDPADAP
jgi:hypothetical protein